MSHDTLTYAVEDGIATLTLSRPDRLNAFTVQMCHEIQDSLEMADADDEVRAVIVTGEGRAFCAGMDLSVGGNVFGLDESVDPYGPEAEKIRDTGGQVTLRIFRMKKPVIGAINGVAVGIGATMTLAMDARVLSERARIGFVFSKVGISMEACSSWFLPRLVGMETALDWALSGEIIGAAEAHRAGFARHLVAPEDLLPTARKLAQRYARGTAPVSVAVNRQLLWRMAGAAHPMEAHKIDSRTMFELSMRDGKEGVSAFAEKRAPAFTGKVSRDMPRALDWEEEPGFE
ncbi:crotonase/enoyl-CoA hydratase family protein [Mameliella sediminis]|uniref:crotonase/enoyl-CoA hydratase family protein n=1 Tax=Mameliella sediminis TaxID=2836866 RepID=UPI001C44CA36|nr:crotonase/enoyl-CoA hydratase family protein [Mameliella sediminis]MBV7392661.1 crotonase/enoyl-CoA hydratase family protein [Mameliella sediminis]